MLYTHQLITIEHAAGDNEQVKQHRSYALRVYSLYLIGKSILWARVPVIWMWYTSDTLLTWSIFMSTIVEVTCLVYLYSKLVEGYMCKFKQ